MSPCVTVITYPIKTFCVWLSGTIVTSVYESYFRNVISIGSLSFIVLISQSQHVGVCISIGGEPC